MAWFLLTFAEKIKLEAESFSKKPQKTKEIEAGFSKQDQYRTNAANVQASGWNDDVREKTEWSTDSEDEVRFANTNNKCLV